MPPTIESLQAYIHKIRQVYTVIAQRLEELVVILNETENAQEDEELQTIALKVNSFLDKLRVTIYHEMEIVQSIKPVNRHLLVDINDALGKIKKLETFISLSKREATPKIIWQIHLLSQSLENELKKHEQLANETAANAA